MRQVILASTSPQRRGILAQLRIPFRAVDSGYEEDMTLPLPPKKLVRRLALEKALAVRPRYRDAVILAGDTIVVCGGIPLGKPHTAAAARAMLRQVSGKALTLFTALAVVDGKTGAHRVHVSEARVHMRTLTRSEIASYVRTREPLDKAGAFAIQGYGAALIRRIEGDYYAIVGLPLSVLRDELERLGIRPGATSSRR